MSGFAALTGEPDGPPTLPPFGLADGIAALATSFAVTAALRSAEATGRGQVIDMAIIEPILMLLGAQITTFDQLGEVQQRLGNRSVNNAPRNVYRTADGEWVAVSTSSQSIAERVMRLVGRPDVIEQPWFATGHQRAQHADELDAAVGGVDRRPADRRGARRVRGGRGGDRPGVRRARRDERPAVRGDRHGADRRRRRARTDQDAERAVPPVRPRPARSAGPAARTAPTPRRCSPSSASTPPSSPACASGVV